MNETGEIALLPENYSDKVFAILLGLADGATHARDDIDPGATEILPLYLADGLLEALEWANDGVASDEAACMWLAALRSYNKLTGSFPENSPQPLNRWIDEEFTRVEIFETIHQGDPLNLSGLNSVDMGQAGRPTGVGADSTGVLPRAAIAALLGRVPVSTTATLARSAAFLTHDKQAAETCIAAAKIIRSAMELGEESASEWPELLEPLEGVAADALREIVSRIAAGIGLSPTAAYDAYFAEDNEEETSEESDIVAAPAAAEVEVIRDPEVDAYAVALLTAIHGSDAVGERPASALDDIISELHDRWMALLV
ncbi:ADP-ribosylglycohydrolase family protein [Glutamicibacter sp. NPDC087344]|uniref:ADP-ribosylglycohydrolase family protein n=1 Tax=Glutamicibacter sp. NPDC087344 TaxID=3363994 RepID=UPI00381D909F